MSAVGLPLPHPLTPHRPRSRIMPSLGLAIFYGMTGIGTVAGTVLYAQTPTPVPVTPEAPFGGYGSNIAGAIFAVGSVLIALFGMAYQSWLKYRKEEIALNNESEKAKRERVEMELAEVKQRLADERREHQVELERKQTIIGEQNMENGRLTTLVALRDTKLTDAGETIVGLAEKVLEVTGRLKAREGPQGPTASTSIDVPQTTGGEP